MGYWICPYCGNSDIPGSSQSCPNCGRTRDNTVKFYPPGHRPSTPKVYVTDHDKAERLRNSPDWHCSYCDSLVNHYKDRCPSCGHTRSESDKNYYQLHPERKSMRFSSDEIVQSPSSSDDEEYHRSTARNTTARNTVHEAVNHEYDEPRSTFGSSHTLSLDIPWKQIGIILLIVALVAGIAVGAWFIFSPKERYITVTDMYWARSIDIEEYRTVRESDWYVPDGGRTQYTQQEIHHYDTVFDHYDTVTRSRTVVTGYHTETSYYDLGNGYFEETSYQVPEYGTEYYTEQEAVYRQDPVYRTKYYYDIERWKYDCTVRSGAHDKEPYWPETNITDEKHRTGARSQSYNITAVYEDKSNDYTMNYNDWIETSVGDELHVLVHFGGRIELIMDEPGSEPTKIPER